MALAPWMTEKSPWCHVGTTRWKFVLPVPPALPPTLLPIPRTQWKSILLGPKESGPEAQQLNSKQVCPSLASLLVVRSWGPLFI